MLENDITTIPGIGPKKAIVLTEETGIKSLKDLLYYAPRKYLDRSKFLKIIDCFVNQEVTVCGIIKKINIQTYGKRRLEVVIDDGTDTISGIFFGAFKYFKKIFSVGDFVYFSGKVNFFKKKQIVHPEFDFIDNSQNINTGRIIPLYRSSEKLKSYGFTSRGFRKIISYTLENYNKDIIENISADIINRYKLLELKNAIKFIHFPNTLEDIENARKRLAFNELFFLQYYLLLSKKNIHENYNIKLNINSKNFLNKFYKNIPFSLTIDQERAISEIEEDLKKNYPMHRLLQGDVGSGKTIVAIAAALFITDCESQVAFMAPTEVLAKQHYETVKNYIPENVSIALLTGSLSNQQKQGIYDDIKSGKADIIIGTHALIQKNVIFKNLRLIIVDEQHRFGVEQRAVLKEKGNFSHMLVMTATPIPRSLALTLYGDLDISYIKEKPANRLPIKTLSFPESKLKGVYNSIEKYVSQGRQCFYILPLIEESEKIDLKSANETYEHLKNNIFRHRKIALLHGKMKSIEKDKIMQQFKNKEIDILISTTVIEVGIDIPNANVIIIHHAERFGLSQLHQLRGRVGRGQFQSFCVLVYPDNTSQESIERIQVIVNNNDGFKIAEEDLKLRGAGDLIGSRQHGLSSNFIFTDLSKDYELLIIARNEADKKISKISNINKIMKAIEKNLFDNDLIRSFQLEKILSLIS